MTCARNGCTNFADPGTLTCSESCTLQIIIDETQGAGAAKVRLEFGLFEAFTVVSLMQLAWRHPRLSGYQRSLLETYGRATQAMLARHAPMTAAFLDEGWDVSRDVPIQGDRS